MQRWLDLIKSMFGVRWLLSLEMSLPSSEMSLYVLSNLFIFRFLTFMLLRCFVQCSIWNYYWNSNHCVVQNTKKKTNTLELFKCIDLNWILLSDMMSSKFVIEHSTWEYTQWKWWEFSIYFYDTLFLLIANFIYLSKF